MIRKVFLAIGLGAFLHACGSTPAGPLTGTVERVWEDGFSINTGSGTVRVDTFAVCGDSTAQAIAVGDEITVEGNSGMREFDATAITTAAGDALCAGGAATPTDEGSGTPTGGAAPTASLVGSVEQVWEDGFEINTGDGTTRVDAWDICGDNTQQNIAVGDEITVAGRPGGLEFDATAITTAAGDALCAGGAAAPADAGSGTPTGGAAPTASLVGSVEQVWEDGFEINTGDGTTRVDAWEICGDNTQQNIAIGDELTVDGRSSGLEFDASAITNADGQNVCS